MDDASTVSKTAFNIAIEEKYFSFALILLIFGVNTSPASYEATTGNGSLEFSLPETFTNVIAVLSKWSLALMLERTKEHLKGILKEISLIQEKKSGKYFLDLLYEKEASENNLFIKELFQYYLKDNNSDLQHLLSIWEQSSIVHWNRAKIMIVGAGRAGKTSLGRSLVGEEFIDNLGSTIGIEDFHCNITLTGKEEKGITLSKCENYPRLLESSIARNIKLKKTNEAEKTEENKKNKIGSSSKETEVRNAISTADSMSENIIIPLVESQFDERDFEQKITVNDVKADELVKVLAENITLVNSDYLVSIYD